MKRILDSSKTITTCVSGNKKSREYNTVVKYKHVKSGFKPRHDFLSQPKRSFSFDSLKFKDDSSLSSWDDAGKAHPLSGKLCMYWSLDEDNKRKVSDPSYVKQAVQETFMQRAHGAYRYKRHQPSAHFPVHTSVSNKTTFAPTQKPDSTRSPKAKPTKPPTPEKHIPKPQVPKRKRLIDTAQPVRHFISRARFLQERRARLGAELKESSEAQLEAMRKKLYDPKPAVLEYLMEKHNPKISGYQLKTRKEKYQADTAEPPPPPFVQRFFGWKKGSKKDAKEQDGSGEDSISITPRAIEVRKPSTKLLSLKRSRKLDESAESSEEGKSEKKKSQRSLKSRFEKNSMTNEERRMKRREAQEREDREAIINKIKNVSTASPRPPQHEYRSIKTQVRDMELTPQIYPKGSLTFKKSYLPISPCRQVVSSNSASSMTPKVVVPKVTGYDRTATSEFVPTTERNVKPTTDDGTGSFTSIVKSLKSFFHKFRRHSSN